MLRHLTGIESLTKEEFKLYLDSSQSFVEVSARDIKKVPSLRGRTILALFSEPSTRTRTSFEIAAKRLSADWINVAVSESSLVKGETLWDTVQTLEAMALDVLIVRHRESGCAKYLARQLKNTAVVNAGDGTHEHPTQALLDCLTLRQHFGDKFNGGLNVAIVGDILHSRVARSNIYALSLMGNKIRLVGPPTLLPGGIVSSAAFGGISDSKNISIHHNLREGLAGVDAVICLRMQLERQEGFYVPSLKEYSMNFGVNEVILKGCAPQAVILHPGPINRGVEVSSDVAYGPRSLVNQQVTNGVAVRMAVLFHAATGGRGVEQ
jgi:aspartate carbamoyltransferase catalytic subunit